MKIVQKDSQKTPASRFQLARGGSRGKPSQFSSPNNKHSKTLKKSKAVKKLPEKSVHNATELPEAPKQKDKKVQEVQPPSSGTVNVKTNLKPPQLEKRKQDATEWKTLKKIDYQRLETVLEEGQLSCEETSSIHTYEESGKSDSETCSEETTPSIGYIKPKKPWVHNVAPTNDYNDLMEGGEGMQLESPAKPHRVQPLKMQQNNEKEEKIIVEESHGEPADILPKDMNEKFAQIKRSVILNGMMEILPIFSNDKFVCSRDAISVEECDDIEPLDKKMSTSEKVLLESKSAKDTGSREVKPFLSGNNLSRSYHDRLLEKKGKVKDLSERRYRCKVLTDKGVVQKTSSPFINSLLILTSFADEKRKIMRDGALQFNEPDFSETGSIQEIEERYTTLKVLYACTVTLFGLISILLGIAWRFYRPPCLLDNILTFVPFMHRRRTYIQLFFDQLIRVMTNVLSSTCKN